MKGGSAERLGLGMTSQRARDRLAERLRERGIQDPLVLAAMRTVPRHLFVDEALESRAYEDIALPIGFGQTISQPYVVARMTELLRAGRELGKVLEIGTGCGYQAAVLAQLAREVYTIERIAELSRQARRRFRMLGYRNVFSRHDDGRLGWPEAAPFDGILVAAAAESLPAALPEQLAEGGVLVAPLGPAGQQRLVRLRRREGRIEEESFDPVLFVPLLPGRG
ncbi:MAG: protein-L-isoaspartate O-methyltransferase [Lysobacterales bacterium]|jgi:protein-L-isoaspartate(D-aspartate) O-methyltransferase|nr:MAG: protein-L-isoaspartate O-methyltransferase [Xanthomonadales bacterium]